MSQEAVNEITQIASQLAQIEDSSVYLTGSAARDELAEGEIAGQREVFSDYEFFVITPKRISSSEQTKIRQQARAISDKFPYQNSLFHVDIAFQPRSRLSKMPHSIFTFEFKSNAKHLAGPHVLSEVTGVNLQSLDKVELNTILYRRLWAFILFMPDAFIKNIGYLPNILTETTTSYLLARNLLDISTVLVPRQGVLLPTYRQRVSWWQVNGLGSKNQIMGQDFLSELARWYEERSSLQFSELAQERYSKWAAYMERALQIVGLNCDAPQEAPSPFKERPLTRGQWLRFAKATRLITQKHGFKTAVTWARLPQKAIRATAHLEMHQSLSCYLQGQERQAQSLLLQSWQWLPMLVPSVSLKSPEADFSTTWLLAKKHWQQYQNHYLRNQA